MDKAIIKVVLAALATILIALNGWALNSISNLRSDLPRTYTTIQRANQDRQIITQRLERMECRIITSIDKLEGKIYNNK